MVSVKSFFLLKLYFEGLIFIWFYVLKRQSHVFYISCKILTAVLTSWFWWSFFSGLKTLLKTKSSDFSSNTFYRESLWLWSMKHNKLLIFPKGEMQNMNLNCQHDEYLWIYKHLKLQWCYREKDISQEYMFK